MFYNLQINNDEIEKTSKENYMNEVWKVVNKYFIKDIAGIVISFI